jgi:hypothetical protein
MPAIRTTTLALVAIGVALAGCAATGTRPHDMSVAEHEAAARSEEAAAQKEAKQYDEDAWEAPEGCGDFCFSTWSNPTSEHAIAARKHRQLAAEHREASAALREAEHESCKGIPERDRDISPFFHRGDIVGVSVEDDDEPPSHFAIRFRPVAGVDAEKMQRLVDCHLARNAARGHVAPEMPYCPLVPRGVSAEVEAEGSVLVVELEVDDEASRQEVRRRVEALAPEGAPRQAAAQRHGRAP